MKNFLGTLCLLYHLTHIYESSSTRHWQSSFLLDPSSCLILVHFQLPVQLYRYFDTSWVQIIIVQYLNCLPRLKELLLKASELTFLKTDFVNKNITSQHVRT